MINPSIATYLVEIGHFALALALAVSFMQASLPLIGIHWQRPILQQIALPLASLQFILLSLASGILVYGFVISDFSLQLVISHSHALQPMLYKISASWGNHEGSMLLWCLVLALFGVLVCWFGGNLPQRLKIRVLAVQAMITTAFLSFLLLTSNPFLRAIPPAIEGQSLNPLLQDPGLAFHPPLLYLGYVGLSLVFSFAIAGLMEGRVDAAFARWVRPWTLVSWGFLTAGIALGSWWAYYELGWGGFWFWDPVENASLMPWLAATALLHTAIVMERRATMKSWTILLAILAFGLSLVGTFLVRSGALTSVHAFANDPERGIYILLILFITLAGGLGLYAVRAPLLKGEGLFHPVSREGALMVNNLLLITILAIVLFGTLYPLFLDAVGGDKLSVGPPYFNKTLAPIMTVLFGMLGVGALLKWKRGDLKSSLKTLMPALFVALACALIGAMLYDYRMGSAFIGLGIAGWLWSAALTALYKAARPTPSLALVDVLKRRLWQLPGGVWGMSLAHFGLGMIVAGGLGAAALTQERIDRVMIGEAVSLGDYRFTLNSVNSLPVANYQAMRASVTVNSQDGEDLITLYPERRIYISGNMETTEAAIHSSIAGDLYVVLGEVTDHSPQQGYVLRIYIKPLVPWMWFGALLLVIGAICSLFDRRLRRLKPIIKGDLPCD